MEFEPLRKADFDADPIEQFRKWYGLVLESDFFQPNTMALATADSSGKPSVRMVLLKDFDSDGFVFYTNYESDKAKELAQNPQAALTFYWDTFRRQVRIEGGISKVSAEESAAYFASRPRGSQLAAWASTQSSVIESRQVLEDQFAQLQQKYEDKEVDRPAYWGGYILSPVMLEFWQHADSRMHDRIRYRLNASGEWIMERLAP